MNPYTIVDLAHWKRREHCMVFRNHIEPAFCVTWELDITRFLQQVRKQHLSFTLAMVYAVSACANQIEEFRYRFIEGDVVLFDKIDTAFTYLDRETELFKVVHVPLQGSLPEYVERGRWHGRSTEGVFYRPIRERCISVFLFAVDIVYAYFPYKCRGQRQRYPFV